MNDYEHMVPGIYCIRGMDTPSTLTVLQYLGPSDHEGFDRVLVLFNDCSTVDIGTYVNDIGLLRRNWKRIDK